MKCRSSFRALQDNTFDLILQLLKYMIQFLPPFLMLPIILPNDSMNGQTAYFTTKIPTVALSKYGANFKSMMIASASSLLCSRDGNFNLLS